MWTIRFLLLGVLILFEIVGGYLHKRRDRYSKIVESAVFNISLVVIGNCICYLIVILPPNGGFSARPDWMQFASVRIGFPVIGSLSICAGASLAFATLMQRKVIGIQKTKEGLLTTGLYRYSRHPIYTGIVCVTLGLALSLRNPDGLLMFPAVLTWIFVGTIFEEKHDMCARFPDRYPIYKQNTRMFGPIWMWVSLVILLMVLVGAGFAAA